MSFTEPSPGRWLRRTTHLGVLSSSSVTAAGKGFSKAPAVLLWNTRRHCLCVYIDIYTTSSLFICWWTFRLLPCLGYCKQCFNEHWCVCMFSSYSFSLDTFSHKKEWNNAICSNMDGPRDYPTKWSKPDSLRHISYDIVSMWNLKNDTHELIYKTQINPQTWLPKGEGVHIHTTTYKIVNKDLLCSTKNYTQYSVIT